MPGMPDCPARHEMHGNNKFWLIFVSFVPFVVENHFL